MTQTISTEFEVPCTQDRAVLVIQDAISQLRWGLIEIHPSRLVAVHSPGTRVTAELIEAGTSTKIRVTVRCSIPTFRKILVPIQGQFVNEVSIRVQTESLTINPTVAVGEGQPMTSSDLSMIANSASRVDRVEKLVALKSLLDSGVLSQSEFETEKKRVLSD